MSAMFTVILGIAVAVLGVLLVRERWFGQILTGAACLAVGAYLVFDGLVMIGGLLQ